MRRLFPVTVRSWRSGRPRSDLEDRLGELRRELRMLHGTLKQVGKRGKEVAARHEEALRALQARAREEAAERGRLADQVRDVATALAELQRRETQARLIAQRDAELAAEERNLDAILQPEAITAHVRRAVCANPPREDPMPFAVVDDVLPAALYDALLRGLPPLELFGDRVENKQQLNLPLEIGPSYSRRVWGFMAETVARRAIMPAVLETFREPLARWLRESFPAVGPDPLGAIEIVSSNGRLMLRTPGYRILPHRDPKWGFITCLLYLARPDDDEGWGTQVLSVRDDVPAPSTAPYWIEPERCEVTETVAFRANRLLVFLNSAGAHAAEIPADAPPSVERYTYQFRIGASGPAIDALLAGLAADQRAAWSGKSVAY